MAGTEGDAYPIAPQDSAGTTFSIGNTISKLKRSLAQNETSRTETPSSAVILDLETIGMDIGEDSLVDMVDDFSCGSSDENMVIKLSDETDEGDKNGTLSDDSIMAKPSLVDSVKNVDNVTSIRTLTVSKSSEGSGNRDNMKIIYSCNHCDYRAKTYSGWNNHFKRLHPRLAQNSSSLVKNYAKVTTSPQKSKVPTLYFCQYCNYITLSMAGFIIHSSKVHPKRKANPLKQGSPITTDSNKKYLEALYSSRDESPRTKSKVRQLLEKYHQDSRVLEEVPRFLSLKCIICKQNCPTAGVLGQHYEMCHLAQGPKKNPDTGLYHCKLCPHESLSRSALYKHYIKNHYMDAFYAWGVPNKQAMLQEKHRYQFNDNTRGDMLERLDNYLPFEILWDVSNTTEQHIAGDDIPCICCDYATQNIIELLSHYHDMHDGQYPNGFAIFLVERLILHAKPVYVPTSEVSSIDEDIGAWVNENGQLIQYYKYECRLCDFKSDWCNIILSHFTEHHPSNNCCSLNVARKAAELCSTNIRPERFSQCILCGFILLDPTEDAKLEHYENRHGGSEDEKFTTQSLTERRHCQDCDFVGNIDAMQWHCADSHFYNPVLWNTLKFDESSSMYGKEFACRVCDFSSKTDWDLAYHYREHHFQPAITFRGEEILGHTQYKCTLCNVTTNSLPDMIMHHSICLHSLLLCQTHEENHKRFLSCNHCRKVYATSAILWRHITRHHCSLSQLFEVDDLHEHTLKYGYWNSSHEPTSEYSKFQNNGSRFPRSARRSRVMEHNDGNASAGSKGSLREKKDARSTSGGSLSSGSITSTPTLKCKFCQFSTTLRGTLTCHLRSVHQHSGNLRCFGCDKRFSIITDCLQHHLHIHGLQISTETAYNFLLCDIVTAQQGGAKFLCVWCGFRGLSRPVVSNHINARHVKGVFGRKKWKKNGPYSCQWCDYYTKNATSMRAHLSMKHERTVSYHSLTNFRSLATDTGKSSDSSDEDYSPSKRRPQTSQKLMKKPCHALTVQCRIAEDVDCLFSEDLKSTHVRFKHDPKHPYICRFCIKAFVCATTFLKHCVEEHSQWCSITLVPQHVVIVPDPGEIAHMKERLEEERSQTGSEDQDICILRESDWPCELCGSEFLSLAGLQQHAFDGHAGRKLLLCRYCDFTSLTEKKIVAHSHLHVRMNGVRKEQHSSSNQRPENEKDANSEDVVDLVTMESNSTESLHQVAEEPEVIDAGEPEISSIPSEQNGLRATPRVRGSFIQKARKSIRGNVKCEQVSKKQSNSNFTQDLSRGQRTVTIGSCEEHVIIESGLISCSKCEFSCTDAQRMETHIRSTHTNVKSYSCKFCDFSSDRFSTLDKHLADFHKIVRNHQLGLHVRSTTAKNGTSDALSESRSRFFYTPTPSLPILREEVVYIQDNRVLDFAGTSVHLRQSNGQNLEDLKCSYCGFKANTTFTLEMHMRRHENAFDEESSAGMNYRMTKMHMTSFS